MYSYYDYKVTALSTLLACACLNLIGKQYYESFLFLLFLLYQEANQEGKGFVWRDHSFHQVACPCFDNTI